MKLNKNSELTLYKNPFSPAYWRDAASQLKNVHILCAAAILIALRVALKNVVIPVGQDLDITFGYFVNSLGAMIFGPVVAAIAAIISDTLGVMFSAEGFSTYFFPFVFVEIAGSVIFALMLWRARLNTTRIIFSRFFVSLVCNFIMNPLIMNVYYQWLGNGKSYQFVTLPRVIKNLALFPLEAFLLVLFLGIMVPVLMKIHILPKGQMEARPEMTKKHLVLLIVLLVVSILTVTLFYSLWMPTQPASASKTEGDFKVTIKSERALYHIKDMDPAAPFAFTVTVKNNGDTELDPAALADRIDLWLISADGTVLMPELDVTDLEAGDQTEAIGAGKSVKLNLTMADLYAALGEISAGEYTVAADFSAAGDGSDTVRAALPIRVK